MTISGNQQHASNMVLLDKFKKRRPLSFEACPGGFRAVALKFASRGNNLDRRLRGLELLLQPRKLFLSQIRLFPVFRSAIRITMISVIGHEKIHITSREAVVHPRIIWLSVTRVGPDHGKGA